jgi:PhnB protein
MTTKPESATDAARIRALVDDWAEALRSKDAKAVVSHHSPDFDHFALAPPLRADLSADDLHGLEAWFASWDGPLEYEFRDLRIAVGEHVAFSRSLNRMAGVNSDGERTELWFRQTLGFGKIGGEWKIVHEHESVPFYMDGGARAAVDLEP